jgi:HEAT repeat protein
MAFDFTGLDAPFAALAAFDWGGDAKPLAVIDEAVVAAHTDAPLRAELEKRFAVVLGSSAPRAAKQYACRKLSLIGTAASVPVLSGLLADKDESHMARFALERITAPEATAALRTALGTVAGDLKIGMVSSLAAKRDAASVPVIAALVTGDSPLAAAAAEALGLLATPAAAVALAAASTAGVAAERVVDARLACAEALAKAGDKAAAQAIYQAIAKSVGDTPTTHRGRAVRMACQRGLFATLDS